MSGPGLPLRDARRPAGSASSPRSASSGSATAGPVADAEVIWLADWALAEAGRRRRDDPDRPRRPDPGDARALGPARRAPASALVEMLSEAAAEGRSVRALESGLEQLAGWLEAGDDADEIVPAGRARPTTAASTACSATSSRTSPAGGRATRSSTGCGGSGTSATRLHEALDRVRDQVHALADLRGPAGRRPRPPRAATTPRSPPTRSPACASWSTTLGAPRRRPRPGRARPRLRPGIGFYSQMIFELVVADARRPGRGLRRRPLRRPGPRARQRPRRPGRRVRLRPGTAARRARQPREPRGKETESIRGYLVCGATSE